MSAPHDLTAHRLRVEDAARRAARAPVRHVTPELLDALHGAWGTPHDVLGVPSVPLRLAATR